jgi:hypothetical protein
MKDDNKKKAPSPIASRTQADGTMIELVYSPDTHKTALAVFRDGAVQVVDRVEGSGGEMWVPVQGSNNLVRHEVIGLPERADPYASDEELIAEIQALIDRYLDLTPAFRDVATYYVLLTWVFDAFGELPLLRFQGEFGSGKTRALQIIGTLCNKGFFASGASTVSPIFYGLDLFKGTLILDEADFRFSDETSEMIKVLNNGNVRGFPVLRQTMTPNREFNPRAFDVFGPKVIAMRHGFQDPALESRCITEVMGQRQVKDGIPFNLPQVAKEEARALRNKLLMYRFRTRLSLSTNQGDARPEQLARTNQILLPLLAVITDEASRESVRTFVAGLETEMRLDRSLSPEGMLLDVLSAAMDNAARSTISVSEVASLFIERYGRDFDRPITPRYVGELLRKRLHVKTYKSHGVFVVPMSARSQVEYLARRSGIDKIG